MKVLNLKLNNDIFANTTDFFANNDFLYANMTTTNATRGVYLVPRIPAGRVNIIINNPFKQEEYNYDGFLTSSNEAYELTFTPDARLQAEFTYQLTLTDFNDDSVIVYRGKLLVTEQDDIQNYSIHGK